MNVRGGGIGRTGSKTERSGGRIQWRERSDEVAKKGNEERQRDELITLSVQW